LSTLVFIAVIAAAIMHGSWNVMVKMNLDRFLSLFLVQTLMGVVGLAMMAAFPLPSMRSVPYAIASGIIHTGYNLFLARSYKTGDLSQVYPIARGTAPLLTLIGIWLFAHEPIGVWGVAGIGVLVLGIWLTAGRNGQGLRLDGVTLFFALGTSAFIGLYTIVDGLGARASGSASGYAGLVFFLDGVFLFFTGVGMRGIGILRAVAPFFWTGLCASLLSCAAYWIAIWAMTQAPIPMVAALRETSILFVIAMSAIFLKERVGLWRYAGGALIVAGAVMLRLS
jgi:drug/metabolite transporter (DMT)-like permease